MLGGFIPRRILLQRTQYDVKQYETIKWTTKASSPIICAKMSHLPYILRHYLLTSCQCRKLGQISVQHWISHWLSFKRALLSRVISFGTPGWRCVVRHPGRRTLGRILSLPISPSDWDFWEAVAIWGHWFRTMLLKCKYRFILLFMQVVLTYQKNLIKKLGLFLFNIINT